MSPMDHDAMKAVADAANVPIDTVIAFREWLPLINTFRDTFDPPTVLALLSELEATKAENAGLREALGALVTAVTFADPPRFFNDVLCHEARVPVEFIQSARQSLGGQNG